MRDQLAEINRKLDDGGEMLRKLDDRVKTIENLMPALRPVATFSMGSALMARMAVPLFAIGATLWGFVVWLAQHYPKE